MAIFKLHACAIFNYFVKTNRERSHDNAWDYVCLSTIFPMTK